MVDISKPMAESSTNGGSRLDDFAKEMQSPLGEIVSLWEKLVSSKGGVNAGVPVADS